MKIWLLLFIPTIFILIILFFSNLRKELHFLEVFILYAVCAVIIFISKFTAEKSLTNDVERLVEYVVSVEHHEYWNEWISQTCTRECCCTTDSKGNRTCGTEMYDCSYREEHYPYTRFVTNTGKIIDIDEGYSPSGGNFPTKFKELCDKFGTTISAIDDKINKLDKDYGKGFRGYVYQSNRKNDNDISTIYPITYDNTYENRVQASSSIFKFEKVDSVKIKFHGLFEYPKYYSDYKSHCILGYNNKQLDDYANSINAFIGSNKQLKVYFLVFKDKSQKASLYQEQYWKGGNKNEAVICIGIDKNNDIKWSNVFSWSDKSDFKVNIASDILKHKNLNDTVFKIIIDESFNTLNKEFKRKEFADFSYLTVEPSGLAIIISSIIVVISCIVLCIFLIKNDFRNN